MVTAGRASLSRSVAATGRKSTSSTAPTTTGDTVEGSSNGVASPKANGLKGKAVPSLGHQNDEHLRPVGIDLGAYSVRVTIAGTSAGSTGLEPITVRYPNAIVRQVQRRSAGAAANTALVGPQIKQQCTNFGSLSVRQPMDRGLIVDWAAQKAILDAALSDALSREKPVGKTAAAKPKLLEGRAVIFTEAYLNLPDLQSALDLLFIEEYGAASIWRCAPALLIPYTPNLFSYSSASADGGGMPGRKRARPECMLVVDLGHGASHVVPVVGDTIIWPAVRRHVISQRLLTNLLKESISFRQWDMMDESWLVGHIKERCCFVAASPGRRGETMRAMRAQRPSEWSFAALVEMCEATAKTNNPIMQEYVLPDYSGPSSAAKYGFIRHGPGSSNLTGGQDDDDDDAFIAADWSTPRSLDLQKTGGASIEEEEEDDSDDDDFDEAADGDGKDDVDIDQRTSTGPRKKQKRSSKPEKPSPKKVVGSAARRVTQDDESEQVLILERERFQVPEAMFNPGVIGLDEAPLHEVICASIGACDANVRGMMWANIVLVGGGARMHGLRRRLINELRPLAPVDAPLHVWLSSGAEDPAMCAIHGAQAALASAPGSALHRMLRSRLLPTTEYAAAGSRERFGSWSSM